MTICLDMMGGDFAPLEAVKGVRDYLTEAEDPALLFLVGDEAQINPLLQQHQVPADKVKVIHAPQVIDYNESPTKALKEKQQSSIAVGFHLLASGKAGAFISAGNTGAMLVGAMYSIKPIEGVQRPTISTIIPKDNGKTGLLLDVGLNADCKPEHLNQFALLGSLYAKHILGIDNPRVALLNIGEEEGKGNLLAQGTYPLLKENTQINFTGNVEGRDVFLDNADVIVCDGFTGNVILKMAESIYEITHRKEIKHEYLDRFDFEQYGGTPVLGVAKPVIIGHGISKAKAFSQMIHLSQKMIATDLMSKLKESFEKK
ncbi:phosphate acyltransferase PlsX [Niastella sp. OAS944]|uniref:phosphate acyltransferase PlsX n=1 Tax=Niastella sp. OAS944 TaxID=2664089 RepID=UPI003476B612|nr:glycerol-3-phosphate acyltransferase PlsX [Chitinophagaceae bacterium OAS944]